MNNFKYTSINRILDKLRRDLGIDDLSETDVIEWSGEALEAIDAVTQFEDALAFIEVKNHTCCLPNGSYHIHQIARNNCFKGFQDDPLCATTILETLTEEEEGPTINPVPIDCNGTPLQEYELAYYRPYFDLQSEFGGFQSSTLYSTCFTPIRLASHTFFAGVNAEIDNKADLYSPANHDEYQVIAKGSALRFSFEEGSIALSYTRAVVDDDGYPMIPDHYSYITAVTKYVTMKVMEFRFYRNERGSDSRLAKAEADWQWYCKQAGNLALMPRGEDDFQDILEQRLHLFPKLNRYYGFFGHMNKAEGRKFNDPDSRNNYFRGFNDNNV